MISSKRGFFNFCLQNFLSWALRGSFGLLLLLIIAAWGSSAQQPIVGPIGDYGDAPDQLLANYKRVDPQRLGFFPSAFKGASDPSYILHRFPQERVFLGLSVSSELNALLVDRDLDDGWVPASFFMCHQAELEIFVTVPPGATQGPIYLNALFDWDHDGRWSGSSTCVSSTRGPLRAEEWAIRNLALHEPPYRLTPGFIGIIKLPAIITGPKEGELWVRLTISSEPVDESVFVPVERGGLGWNGQGDFLYGETEDYFACLLENPNSPLESCPRPLTDQPPIDPPPTGGSNLPLARDDAATICQGTQAVLSVLDNDSGSENAPLAIGDITQPAHGTVTLNPNQTLTYVPNPGFSGQDRFTYVVCNAGGLCTQATVTVTVAPAPTAKDDAASTQEDAPLTLDLLGNDSLNGAAVGQLTLTIISGPSHGSVVINPNRTITYAPDSNFFGNDSFSYAIGGEGICSSNVATVAIVIQAVNDPPSAQDDTATTQQGTPVTIAVLANDSDIDGSLDSSSVTLLSQPSQGTAQVNPDGSITYMPKANFSGLDTFSYRVCDNGNPVLCDSATVTIAVKAAANSPPTANSQNVTTTEDTPAAITLTCSDADGDPLAFAILTTPAHGTLSGTPPNITYTPNANFNGSDSFTFKCNDGQLDSNTATVSITVTPVNDPPQLAAILDQTVTEGQTLILNISCTDIDSSTLALSAANLPPGAAFTDNGNGTGTLSYTPDFDTVQHPSNQKVFSGVQISCSDGSLTDTKNFKITVNDVNRAPTLTILGDQTVAEGSNITRIDFAQCSDLDSDPLTLVATGLPGFAGFSDSHDGTGDLNLSPDFSSSGAYSGNQISCSDGSLTDIKSFTIAVTETNRAPEAFPQNLTTSEDTPLGITLTGSDPDGAPITFSLEGSPSHGTLSGFNPNTGTVTYTPSGNYNGPDSFTFRVNDGLLNSNIATVTITVTPINDPPTLTPILSQSVNEGQTLTLLVSCTDIDGPSLTLMASNLPPGATFADNGDGTGTLTYTPGFDTVQHPDEQIIFSNISLTCIDGSATDTDTFNLTVYDVNRLPDAVNDSATTNEDAPVTVAVLANDSDPDGDTLTVISFSPVANGTVSCTTAGMCTYTPSANFSGTDTFSYTVSDSRGGTDTATVTITVNPINDPPQADNISVTTPKNTPITITLPVRDDNGDPLTCSLISPPSNGTVTVNANCTATYTPNSDFVGTDRFDYRVSDGQLTDEGHVEISVLEDASWDKSSLTFLNAGKTCGDEKTVFATVKNVGSPMQGPTRWELYFSASGDPKKNGVLVASGAIPALDSNETFKISVNVTQKGNYKFRALQRPGHPGKGDLWSDTIRFDCN